MDITTNEEQRLFVITSGDVYSCLGFDVVYGHCLELIERIKKYHLEEVEGLPEVLKSEIGYPVQYQQYCMLLGIIDGHDIGTWFDHGTPNKVRRILETCRKKGMEIRLFYGDNDGRSWMEENDIMGRVGRSTGAMKIPLLIADGEFGGVGILDRCIIKIMNASTQEVLYAHENFHLPEMVIQPTVKDLLDKGYPAYSVSVMNKAGEMKDHARFDTYGQAAHWVAFMSGDCTQPGFLGWAKA